MPTLSRAKANNKGDLVTGYLAVTNSQAAALPYGRDDAGALASYTGSGFILKIIATNYSTANRDFSLYDNGTGGSDSILIYKQFLHQVDLREDGTTGLSTAYTTKAEIIDFPEPGLYFHGNLKAVSNGSSGVALTIIARQA